MYSYITRFLILDLNLLGFETKFSTAMLNYDLFSSLGRQAHCDGAFVKYTLEERTAPETACGSWCRDIQQSMGMGIEVEYLQSKSDHTQVIKFTANTTVAISDHESAKTFFAFRGTTMHDTLNFRRNFLLKFQPTTLCPGCSVHSGFWRNFVALRPDFICLTLGVVNIATVGISMGGPLATLAAYQAFKINKRVRGVVTFGSPRVSNERFAHFLLVDLYSHMQCVGFAYGRDPVPHLPPRFFGYRANTHRLFHIMHTFSAFTDYKTADVSTKNDDFKLSDYLYYDRVYVETGADFGGDKEFSRHTVAYDINDHGQYVVLEQGGYVCAFDSGDAFLQTKTVAELFFL